LGRFASKSLHILKFITLANSRFNGHLPSSLFFENEAVTQKLQPYSQNPLSFVYNFCQRLIFATEFFRSYAHPINTHNHLAERPNFRAPGKSFENTGPKSLRKFGSYRFLFGHVRSYPRELDSLRIPFIMTTACLCIGWI